MTKNKDFNPSEGDLVQKGYETRGKNIQKDDKQRKKVNQKKNQITNKKKRMLKKKL